MRTTPQRPQQQASRWNRPGAQFPSFTGTRVQILTPEALRARAHKDAGVAIGAENILGVSNWFTKGVDNKGPLRNAELDKLPITGPHPKPEKVYI